MQKFFAALLLTLGTSMVAPLWLLFLGPVLLCFGAPLVFDERQRVALFFASLLSFVSLLRIFFDFGLLPHQSPSPSQHTLEVVSYMAALLSGALFWGRSAAHILCAVLLGAVFVWAVWHFPLWMAGAFLVAHNFLCFVAWMRGRKKRKEKILVAIGALLYFVLHLLLFRGSLDFLFWLLPGNYQYSWTELNPSQVAKTLLPWTSNYLFWFHAILAYSFGATFSFFLGLELHGVSKLELKSKFRSRQILLFVLSVLGSAFALYFFRVPDSRVVFFGLAFYRCYLELLSLAQTQSQKTN